MTTPRKVQFFDPGDLRGMSVEFLKGLRGRWYSEAINQNVLGTIQRVTRALGRPLHERYGPKYEYVDGDLAVYLDDYGGYMSVTVAGRAVCHTHSGEQLFVPGPWVDRILAREQEADDKSTVRRMTDDEIERARLIDQLSVGQPTTQEAP